MKARYSITNHPGVVCLIDVEYDNGKRDPLSLPGIPTVFECCDYAKQGLKSRGMEPTLIQSWTDGAPTWKSNWIDL